MLVVSAILGLAILVIKELLDTVGRFSRVSNILYLPVLPLLVFFGIAAHEKIISLPMISS